MSPVVKRLCVERGSAVGLIVLDEDLDRLIFVRQFRYPTVSRDMPFLLECAAGMIDKGETPEEAARRELLEELGYRVGELVLLDEFFSSPGGSSEHMTMYFARVSQADVVHDGGGVEHEDEDVERVEFTRAEVESMLLNRGFSDAKTLAGVQAAKLRGLI
jgi:ADP-ribose pyrophosphatase